MAGNGQDGRRLHAVPAVMEAAVPDGDVVGLAVRADGRRSAVPRPRAANGIRKRSAVPAGPVAQHALRRRLLEQLDEAAGAREADDGAVPVAFSVAVVEVDPTASRHPVGRERLLTALGRRLADATRPTDLVVRPTPSRFVLVLSGARDGYGLAAARRRIRDVLSRPVLIDGRPVRSTVSVGVVPAAAGDTVDGLLARLGESATRDRRSMRRLRSVEAPERRG